MGPFHAQVLQILECPMLLPREVKKGGWNEEKSAPISHHKII